VPEQTQPKKIRLTLSPQAQRYARRDAPREVRLMAARGALPLPPVELASVLFALVHDPDAEVKETARTSLESLPDSVCDAVLGGPAHPAVLSYLAHVFADHEARLERIALNPAADDATIAFLATRPSRRVVEIVANNQERLLRAPEIVEALGSNPLTGRSVTDRILSFLGVSALEEQAEHGEVSDEAAVAALRAVLGADIRGMAHDLVAEFAGDEGEAAAHSDNIYALIQKMTIFQKIQLARLGNKEARGLLVRDRNKLVALAAITSPKLSENEVAGIAQSRSVSDEVLRMISVNSQWTRNYQVKLALVTNPRCPLAQAVKFVNYLQDKDLRAIMKSKDVSTPIATHARRVLMKKGKL
jgi:hypothetical protein